MTETNSPSTGTSFVYQYLTNGTLNDVVFADMENAAGMATDGKNAVYVGFAGGIESIPTDNPGSPQYFFGNASIYSLAVDPANTQHVYGAEFAASGRIYIQELGVDSVFAAGQANPVSISVVGSRVFWANLGTSANNYTDGSISMCPTGGGGGCTSTTRMATGNYCASLTTDASDVYFNCDRTLYRCPLSGCGAGPTALAGAFDINGPTLASDATALYWVTEFGDLMKLAK